MTLGLVGDIGGTNARFALWREGRLEAVEVLSTADFAGPEAAVREYLARQGLASCRLQRVCLACAGPVQGNLFHFTNNPWTLDRAAFVRAFGLQQLLLINDFQAMALGMTRVPPEARLTVRAGEADAARPALVIGPGTGLGVATLLPRDAQGRWHALEGEGGHASLPVGDAREAALWACLRRRVGHVEAETVLCGGGLVRLYQAACELDGERPRFTRPAEITGAALAGDRPAVAVLEQFCRWLGRVAGDHALTLGARGGVYIVGGVVPRFAEFFLASGFASAFVDKGGLGRYLEQVPVWLVTGGQPGLEGAAVALGQALAG